MRCRRSAIHRCPALVCLLSVASMVAVASCSAGSSADEELPAGPPVVEVTMSEYSFTYSPPTDAGRVVFRARNAGTIEHEMGLYPLSEDFPPIDEQLHGSERRLLTPFARAGPLSPGEQDAVAVDLVPGRRYALICFVRDPGGTVHALRGMNSEFQISGASMEAPGTDLTR